MITVLENVKDREQVSSEDKVLHLAGEESGQEEEFSELEITPQKREFELGEDSLNLYLDEVGQTPLLNAEEERVLTSQIEEGKHLSRLEKDWLAEHGTQPSAIDLLLALMERFSRARLLFETLYQYLDLPSHGSIAEKVSHPDLRHAIDGNIDQHLSSAIAKITGASQTGIEKTVIELSLDSRLISWHIIEEAGRKSSLAEFGEVLQSPEFHDKLEAHRSEIVKHFEQIRERTRQATNHMIQANLRLVVSVAKGHIGWGVPLPDLIQEGNIGLMQAVQKFDHRRGYRFSTYAIPWIWQAINRAVIDKSRIVRLPGHVVDDLTKLARARKNLAQKLGRQPTEKELASETGLRSKKIESLLKLSSGGPVSFETPVGEEGSQLGDFIADEAILQPEEQSTANLLREELSKTLESLTPRERRIIELRFGLGNEYSRTLAEVGTEFGLSKERIRQIEKEALAKLRHPSNSRELIGYLG
ncbi:MAG TPA: RNA polymerase sigma factor RpoD/SigA [Dehalococcoidia bacterium]|nr:RNA polymerase sigma factor RpoD/SigA [Dehalococcoidia bacterium]